MFKKFAFTGLILYVLANSLSALAVEVLTGKVVGVSDGDTITVLDASKTQHKIRLYGIDCPESGQDFGQVAKQAMSDFVFGKDVRVTREDVDRYGRIVGMVFADGVCINEEMIRLGYAWVYDQYCKSSQCNRLKVLQITAQINKDGLWDHPDPTPPWEYRRKPNKPKETVRPMHQGKFETETNNIKSSPATMSRSGPFQGNTQSRVFHSSSCRYYNCKNCTAGFSSKEEAISAGFKPCKICNP